MARNKFDVDETLETPFNIKHLLRAGVYIGRHKKKMILSLLFSAISAACTPFSSRRSAERRCWPRRLRKPCCAVRATHCPT